MSRTRTSATLFGMFALLLVACSGPRKATERACRKAEKHVARAVWLCPQVLEVDTAPRTVDVAVPGDSAAVPVKLAHSLDVDSILAACEELQHLMALELEELRQVDSVAPAIAEAPRAARKQAAVTRIQRTACQWEPQTYEHELFSLTVSPGETGPLLMVRVKDRVVTADCPPCPPRVQVDRVVNKGVHPGWKTFGQWVIGLISLVVLLGIAVVVWVLRNHHAG